MQKMINKPATAILYSLLKDGEKRPVVDIITDFSTKVPRSQHNAICSALVILLEDTPKFLKPTERLVAFALLHHSYASANPYVSLLINIANDAKTDTYEKSFIRHLLGGAHVVLNLSAAVYINKFDSASNSFALPGPLPKQPDPFTCFFKDAAIKNVIPDPDFGPGDVEETVTGLIQSSSLDGLYPHWARPVPPRLPVLEGELKWVNPENIHSPVWDLGMCVDPSAVVRELVQQALKGPLAPGQQERVLLLLKSNPSLVYDCGLTPKKLPELVENNKLIAVEVLIKLMDSPKISDYLTVLVSMELSLHSMEVVNLLTTEVKLPVEFVHLYIINCISSCENVKEKFMQLRLARLVCVFLRNLITNNIINAQDVFLEVQTFCIEYSKMPEAAGLFRLLKTL